MVGCSCGDCELCGYSAKQSRRRVARLIIYEGTEEALDRHLAQAKPDGLHYPVGPVSVRVITLPPSFLMAFEEAARMIPREEGK